MNTYSGNHIPSPDMIYQFEKYIKTKNIHEIIQKSSKLFPNDIFARGFHYTKTAPKFIPHNWSCEELLGGTLFRDHRVGCIQARSGDALLAAIGDIFDTRAPERASAEIVASLVRRLDTSLQDFLDELSWCHGRYVLLFRKAHGHIHVLTDACGMRSVFYDEAEAVSITSHAALHAVNLFEDNLVDVIDVPCKFGFPGRFTPYVGVYMLTPNTYLDLEDKAVIRYYPVKPIPEKSPKDAARDCAGLIQRSAEAFVTRKPVIMSLTAGLDSRTVLACVRPVAERVHFFTYYRADHVDTDWADRQVACEIARDLGLAHTLITTYDIDFDKEFQSLCALNAHYKHIRSMNYWYFREFRHSDVFHLRSNLSEIGRAFYAARFNPKPLWPLSPASLLRCYVGVNIRKHFEKDPGYEAVHLALLDEFISTTKLDEAAEHLDYRDLFYWEHRMGCWHSQVASESDVGVNSVSAYNSRVVLENLLAPPFEARRGKEALYEVIRLMWPELLDYPCNPKMEPQTASPPAAT